MKNILIITGSARKNGNTSLLADNFIKGALEAGHQVTKYETAQKNFKPCVACDACWTNGLPCVFNDETTNLSEQLAIADVIVLASPLYWFSFTSFIKLAIDKFYPFIKKQSPFDIRHKEAYLLTCGGIDDKEAFEPLLATFNEITKYLKWEDKKAIVAEKCRNKGDVIQTKQYVEAYQAGLHV